MPDRKQPHHTGDEFMHVPDDQGNPLPEKLNRHELEDAKEHLRRKDEMDEDAVWGDDRRDEEE